jgi:hypothetical protein
MRNRHQILLLFLNQKKFLASFGNFEAKFPKMAYKRKKAFHDGAVDLI